MKQITTLSLIEKGDEVLLAMKKRGFGEGWWNGFGGKPNEGESIEDAAIRELEEESGIIAKTQKQRGKIIFDFRGGEDIIEMHVFEVTEYTGEPVETEEMRPQWFKKEDAPYHEMWPADREWMPLFFDGKDFEGKATFDAETKTFIEADFRIIDPELKPESEIPSNARG